MPGHDHSKPCHNGTIIRDVRQAHRHVMWQTALFRLLVIATLIGGVTSLSESATPQPTSMPRAFGPGERLTYAVKWLTFRAGTAVMEVAEASPHDGHPALRLVTTAKSEPPVSSFFLIDDRIESIVDANTLSPQRMIFQKREGKKHTDLDVTFHHADGMATTIKDGVSETSPIPPGTQHAFSVLYYLRNLPSVTVGSSHTMNVHHEKKNYPIEVRAEALEEIEGAWGWTKALRVSVFMPFTGIWMNAGSMQVWVTNDARHLPLRVKAKVIIGSIVADLIDGPGITEEFDDSSARNAF